MMDTKDDFVGATRYQSVAFRPPTVGARLAKTITLITLLLFIGPGTTASSATNNADNSAIRIVQEEIERFSREFPALEFLWLTGKSYSLDMLKLSLALGENHELLDYEHHAHQVEALNSLNLDRIKMMLSYDSPSSSLYRVRNNQTHGKPYLVVITLNPSVLIGEPGLSTRFIYDINSADYSNISKQSRVKNDAYLRYVMRHEIAHALKAYLFSGHAFTAEPLGGDYNSYLSEIWADMFAVMMEQRFGSGDMDFIRKLLDARTVNLVTSLDIQHFTSPQMENVLQAKPADASSLGELAGLVQEKFLEVKPSFNDYEALAMTAHHLRYALEGSSYDRLMHDGIIAEYEDARPHEGLLAQLLEKAESAMHRVFR